MSKLPQWYGRRWPAAGEAHYHATLAPKQAVKGRGKTKQVVDDALNMLSKEHGGDGVGPYTELPSKVSAPSIAIAPAVKTEPLIHILNYFKEPLMGEYTVTEKDVASLYKPIPNTENDWYAVIEMDSISRILEKEDTSPLVDAQTMISVKPTTSPAAAKSATKSGPKSAGVSKTKKTTAKPKDDTKIAVDEKVPTFEYRCYSYDPCGAIVHCYDGDAPNTVVAMVELPPLETPYLYTTVSTAGVDSNMKYSFAAHAVLAFCTKLMTRKQVSQLAPFLRTNTDIHEWVYPPSLGTEEGRMVRVWWQCLARTQGRAENERKAIRERIWTELNRTSSNMYRGNVATIVPQLHQVFATLGCQSSPFSRNPDGWRGRILWHATGSGKTISIASCAVQLTLYSPFVLQTVILSPPSVKGEHLEEMRRCGMPAYSYIVISWVKNVGAPYFHGFKGTSEGTIITKENYASLEADPEEAMKCCVNSCVVMDEIQDMLNAAPMLLTKLSTTAFQSQPAAESDLPTLETCDTTYFEYVKQLCRILIRNIVALGFVDGLEQKKPTLYTSITNFTPDDTYRLPVIDWLRDPDSASHVRGFLEHFVFTRPAARAWSSLAPRELFVSILNTLRRDLPEENTPIEFDGFKVYRNIWSGMTQKTAVDDLQLKNPVDEFFDKYDSADLMAPDSELFQLACFLCYQIIFSEPAKDQKKAVKEQSKTPSDDSDDSDSDDDVPDQPDPEAMDVDQPEGVGARRSRREPLRAFSIDSIVSRHVTGLRKHSPIFLTNRLPTLAFLWAADCTIGATATLYRKTASDPITLLGFFAGVPAILNSTYSPSPVERVALYSGGSCVSMFQTDPFAINMQESTKKGGFQDVVQAARNNETIGNWLWVNKAGPKTVEQNPVWQSYNQGKNFADTSDLKTFGIACSRPTIGFAIQAVSGVLMDNFFMTQEFMTSSRTTTDPLNVLFGFPNDSNIDVNIDGCTFAVETINGEEWQVCVQIEFGKTQEVMKKLPEMLTGDRPLGIFIKYRPGSTVLDAMFENLPATLRTTFFKQYTETLLPTRMRFLATEVSALSKVPERIGGGIINVTLPLQEPAKSGSTDFFTILRATKPGKDRDDFLGRYKNRGYSGSLVTKTASKDSTAQTGTVTYSDVQRQDMAVWQEEGTKVRPTTKFITMSYLAAATCSKCNTVYELGNEPMSRSDKTLIVGARLADPQMTEIPTETKNISVDPRSDAYIGTMSDAAYTSKPNSLVAIQWTDALRAAVDGLSKLNRRIHFDDTDAKITQWLGAGWGDKFFSPDADMFKVQYRNKTETVTSKIKLSMKKFEFDSSNYVWEELVKLIRDCRYRTMEVIDETVCVICDKITYTTKYEPDNGENWQNTPPATGSYWERDNTGNTFTYFTSFNEAAFTVTVQARSIGAVMGMMKQKHARAAETEPQSAPPRKKARRVSYLPFPYCPFDEFLKLEGSDNKYTGMRVEGHRGAPTSIAKRLDKLFEVMQWPYGYKTPASSIEKTHCGNNGNNCYVASAWALKNVGTSAPYNLTKDQCWHIWTMLMNTGALGVGVAHSPVLTGTNYKGISCSVRIAPSDSPLTDRQWDGRIWRYGAQQFRGGTWDRTMPDKPVLVPRVAQFLLCASRFAPPALDSDADISIAQTLLLNSYVVNMNRQIEASAASDSKSESMLFCVSRLSESFALADGSITKQLWDQLRISLKSFMTLLFPKTNHDKTYARALSEILTKASNRLRNDTVVHQYMLMALIFQATDSLLAFTGKAKDQTMGSIPVTDLPNMTWNKFVEQNFVWDKQLPISTDMKRALNLAVASAYAHKASENYPDPDSDLDRVDDMTSTFTGAFEGTASYQYAKEKRTPSVVARAKQWATQRTAMLGDLKEILGGNEMPERASWSARYNSWVESDTSGATKQRSSAGESICMPFIGEPLVTRIASELGYSASTDDDSQPHVLDFLATLTPPTNSTDLLAKNAMTRGLYNEYTWGQLIPLTVRAKFCDLDSAPLWMRGTFDADKVKLKKRGSKGRNLYSINECRVVSFWGKADGNKITRLPESMMLFYQKCKLGARFEEWENLQRKGFDEDFTTRMLQSRIDMLMAKEHAVEQDDTDTDKFTLSEDLVRISIIQSALYEMVSKSEWKRFKVPSMVNKMKLGCKDDQGKDQERTIYPLDNNFPKCNYHSANVYQYRFDLDDKDLIEQREPLLTEKGPILSYFSANKNNEIYAALVQYTRPGQDNQLNGWIHVTPGAIDKIYADVDTAVVNDTISSHAHYYTFEGLKRAYRKALNYNDALSSDEVENLIPTAVRAVQYKLTEKTIGTLKTSDVCTDTVLAYTKDSDGNVTGFNQFFSVSNEKLYIYTWSLKKDGDHWTLTRNMKKEKPPPSQWEWDSLYTRDIDAVTSFTRYEGDNSMQNARHAWFVMAVINDLYESIMSYHNDFRKLTYSYASFTSPSDQEITKAKLNGTTLPWKRASKEGNEYKFPEKKNYVTPDIANAASMCFTAYLTETVADKKVEVSATYQRYRDQALATLAGNEQDSTIWGKEANKQEYSQLIFVKDADTEEPKYSFYFRSNWDGQGDVLLNQGEPHDRRTIPKGLKLPGYDSKYDNRLFLKQAQFGKKTALAYPFDEPDDTIWDSMQNIFSWHQQEGYRKWQQLVLELSCDAAQTGRTNRIFYRKSVKDPATPADKTSLIIALYKAYQKAVPDTPFQWFEDCLLAYAVYNPIFRKAVIDSDNGGSPAVVIKEGQRWLPEFPNFTMRAIDNQWNWRRPEEKESMSQIKNDLQRRDKSLKEQAQYQPLVKFAKENARLYEAQIGEGTGSLERGIIEAAVNCFNLDLVVKHGTHKCQYLPRPDLLLYTQKITENPQPLTLNYDESANEWSYDTTARVSKIPTAFPKSMGKRRIPLEAIRERRDITHQNQLRLIPKLSDLLTSFTEMKALGVMHEADTSKFLLMLAYSFDDLIDTIESVCSTDVNRMNSSIGKLYGNKKAILQGVTFENADMRRISIVVRKRNDEVLISKKLAVCSRDAAQNALAQNIAYESAQGYDRTMSMHVYKMFRTGVFFINSIANQYSTARKTISTDYALRPSITSICAPDTTFKPGGGNVKSFKVQKQKQTVVEMITSAKVEVAGILDSVRWNTALLKRLYKDSRTLSSTVELKNTIFTVYKNALDSFPSNASKDSKDDPHIPTPDQKCQLEILNNLIGKLARKLQYKTQNKHKMYDFLTEVTRDMLNEELRIELTNVIPTTNPEPAAESVEESVEELAEEPVEEDDRSDAGSEFMATDEPTEEEDGSDAGSVVDEKAEKEKDPDFVNESDGDESDEEGAETDGADRARRSKEKGRVFVPYFKDNEGNSVEEILDAYLNKYLDLAHVKEALSGCGPMLKHTAYHWCSFCRKLRGLISTMGQSDRDRVMIMIVTATLNIFRTVPLVNSWKPRRCMGNNLYMLLNRIQDIGNYSEIAEKDQKTMLLTAYLLDQSVYYGPGRETITQFVSMWWCTQYANDLVSKKTGPNRMVALDRIEGLRIDLSIAGPRADVDLIALQENQITQNNLGVLEVMNQLEMIEMIKRFGYSGTEDEPGIARMFPFPQQ